MPEKNSGMYKIRTHDLCNTSAVLYQLSNQLPVSLLAQLVEHWTSILKDIGSNSVYAWIFSTAVQVGFITVKITFIITSPVKVAFTVLHD